MAEAILNVCNGCGKSIEAWADGNPYYIQEDGQKKYAYHPNHEGLEKCIGNDSPHLCLSCGEQFKVDSRVPLTNCPKCGTSDFEDIFLLDGKKCPYCKDGVFKQDSNYHCIS